MKTKKSEFPALVKITVSSLHRLLSVPNGLRYVLLQLFSSALGVLISFGYILLPGLIINELTAEIHWRSLLLKILLLALCPVANHCCNLDSLVNSLPHGENTQIYKNIAPGGFDPSGGEAQKIAIARALYYDRKICILDEPTAALDPNAEYEIYTKFHELIQGKTAVLITHRLSAVQLADVVAVFDNGKLSEYGTHRELYEQGGKYKEMYDKQAAFYVKSDTSAAAE